MSCLMSLYSPLLSSQSACVHFLHLSHSIQSSPSSSPKQICLQQKQQWLSLYCLKQCWHRYWQVPLSILTTSTGPLDGHISFMHLRISCPLFGLLVAGAAAGLSGLRSEGGFCSGLGYSSSSDILFMSRSLISASLDSALPMSSWKFSSLSFSSAIIDDSFVFIMEAAIKSTKKHCAFCFETLIAHLDRQPQPAYPSDLPNASVPLFVTWNKLGYLRGCIGVFQPDGLKTLLAKYAITSAVKDNRFPPISKAELDKLSVAVSFLVNFQKDKKAYDWEVGKHGIIIEIAPMHRATFLPQVAKQQGWDKKQTLRHLLKKAGYTGTLEQAEPLIKLTTYESSKQQLSYSEFISGDWKQ